MTLLTLQESAHFVSLHDASRRGRLERAAKMVAYPVVYAWLLALWHGLGWRGERVRLRGLTFRPRGLDMTLWLGTLEPPLYVTLRRDAIERLVFEVGPEGDREVELTMRVRYRSPRGGVRTGEATFAVVDVDTHREAMGLLVRAARMLGCGSYRVLAGESAPLSVELLLTSEESKVQGYRRAARAADIHPIVDHDEVVDFAPREHGGFVEPEGEMALAPQPELAGITVFEPGRRVVAGELPRPWLLWMAPLLIMGWLLLWALATLVVDAILGAIAAVLTIITEQLGFDTWGLFMGDATLTLLFVVSAIVALTVVAPPGWAYLHQIIGSKVRIDWEGGYVERRSGLRRLTMPIGHVRGVDVRVSLGRRRLLLRTAQDDLSLATGDRELTPLAVALARSLDVPVSVPEDD